MNQTRLPHVLPPEAYRSNEQHAREQARIFGPGWHAVGALDEIPRDGDFFTREVQGKPLLVRNHEGSPRAFLNVCAHRHSLLTHAPRGSLPRLRCQYHGWEYDGDGAACKIPDAACFTPLRRGEERLRAYRTATLGKLLFVAFDDGAIPLDDWLGPRSVALGRRLFGGDVRLAFDATLDHPCNWKIPLENVLESYHVPLLHDNVITRHPRLFRVFNGAPAGEREAHELGDRFTEAHDSLGGESKAYRALLRLFRATATTDFVLHHAFPNLLFGHSAVISFFQVVHPVTATTSRSFVRMYLDLGQPARPLAERLVAPLVDRVAERLYMGVMREDFPIFPDLQRGLSASPHPGVLGAREERVHHFQAYVAEQTAS